MADEKSKIVTDATVPDAGSVPAQPEAGGGTPAPKQEQTAPETETPEAKVPEQAAPAQPNKGSDAPKEQKAASVSVFNISEQKRPRSPRTKRLPFPGRRLGRSRRNRPSPQSAGAARPRPTRTRPPLPHRRKLPAKRIRQHRSPLRPRKRKRPLPLARLKKHPGRPSLARPGRR